MRSSRSGVSNSIAAVVIAVALVLAALGGYFLTSGGAPTTTTVTSLARGPSSTSGSTVTSTRVASTFMQDLAAAAEAECSQQTSTCLTIYTTQDAGNWAGYYGPLFYQQYPWAKAKVAYASWSASDMTTHLLSDYKTKNVVADVATGTVAALIPVYQGGAFLNYTTPEAQVMNYQADGIGPAWLVEDLAIVHMIYNPTLLPASQVPKSWSDLANPIYKGKLAFQSATALSITTAEFYYLYTSMGNSSGQWTSLMKGIAANNPMILSTAGAAESRVLNGQAAVGIDTLDSYVTALKGDPNIPLKIVDIEPMVYAPGIVAIMNGAPHPAMAKLVEAWFASEQGQKGIYETNHLPYITSLGADLTSYLPSDYSLKSAYSTYANTALFQNPGAWSDTFKAIFGA